jgi:hypothetical protein
MFGVGRQMCRGIPGRQLFAVIAGERATPDVAYLGPEVAKSDASILPDVFSQHRRSAVCILVR